MVTERTTSVHAYIHAHRPQLSIRCSCDLLTNLLTDLLTHRVTNDEYHQSQRGSALSSSLYSNQSKSHHSELDALVSCLRVTTSSCLRFSEFYVETVTHMLQPPVSCWMMCVFLFLNYILHKVALVFQPAILKKNSHKGRNLFFLGELMSTALQGGRSHFGEAGLSLYSLLPRI